MRKQDGEDCMMEVNSETESTISVMLKTFAVMLENQTEMLKRIESLEDEVKNLKSR